MSVAVATSPALAGGHSPSLRHRDDPGLFNDVRPSQLVTCLDLLPSSPLLYSTPKMSSPFLYSPSHPGMPPPSPRVQCSPRPSSIDMPPPSPRVQCSPRTSSWPSSAAPSSTRSCPCGGQPACLPGCCSLSASPNESKWRFSPSDIKFTLDSHLDSKFGIPTFEPPSPRSNTSPCKRYPRGTTSLPSVLDSPSPRFGSAGGIFTPRTIPRPSSTNAKFTPSILLGSDDNSGIGEMCRSALPKPWISRAEGSLRLEVPADPDDVALDSPSKFNAKKEEVESAIIVERPATPPLKRKRPPKLDIQLCTSPASSMPHVVDLGEEAMNDLTVEGSYYGIACKKGRRKTLEDTHRAVPELHGDPLQAFFGVFDGHGGRMAADFVAENMVSRISEAIVSSEKSGESIESAVREGYLATDAEFLQKGVGSGASCVTALVKDGHLVVANAGDCRAVLSRAGVAEALTCDHRASREDERQRIENLGGYVDNVTGPWRVQGTLAISRGIGDLHMKEWITAEPEVQRLPITSDCEFLILASDGLWDVVSNQEAVDIARPLLQAERMNTDVMDLQIPLAMASSSLSRGDDDGVSKSGERGNQSSIVKPFDKWLELNSSQLDDGGTVSSVDDDEDVDYCVGTLDNDMPNVGFPELPAPAAGPASACKRLVEESVKRGCLDDISVMIVDRIFSTFKGNQLWRVLDSSSNLGSEGIVSSCATKAGKEGFESSSLQFWPKAR